MIQQALNTLLAFMMARFMLNDVPHMLDNEEEPKLPKELIPDVTKLISEGEPIDTKKIMRYLDPTKEGAKAPDSPFVVFGYRPPPEGGDSRFFLAAKGDVYGHAMNDAYDAKQHELIEQQEMLEKIGLHEEADKLQPLIGDPVFALPGSASQILLRDGIVTQVRTGFGQTKLGSTLYTFVVMVGEFDPQPVSANTAVTYYDYMLQLYFVLGEGSESPIHRYGEYVRLANLGYLGMIR